MSGKLPFEIMMFCFAALGAFVNWLTSRYGQNVQRGLDQLIDEIASEFKGRLLLQVIFFSLLGAIISVGTIEPATLKQAFAAGTAWTGVLGSVATFGTKRKKSRGTPST